MSIQNTELTKYLNFSFTIFRESWRNSFLEALVSGCFCFELVLVLFRINDITTTLKLSNNFSPLLFRSPLLTLTADASLNPTLTISLEKLPLNVKYLEQSKTLTSCIIRLKQKFIQLTIHAVITTFQQWVAFWGGNQNSEILQWQWENCIASFGWRRNNVDMIPVWNPYKKDIDYNALDIFAYQKSVVLICCQRN